MREIEPGASYGFVGLHFAGNLSFRQQGVGLHLKCFAFGVNRAPEPIRCEIVMSHFASGP